MPSPRAAFAVAVLAFAAAGCGGSGGSSLAPPGGVQSAGAVDLKIVIPARVPAAKRKPTYVSPSVASIVVQILSGTTPLNVGPNFFNVSSTTSGCSTSAGATTCNLSVQATIASAGTYTVAVATYDAAQTGNCVPYGTPACAGNVLSFNALPESITPGVTSSINITLGGIPAYLQGVEFLSGYIAPGNGGSVNIYGPGPQSVEFQLLDAQKNAIVGPGMPNLTVTSGNPSVLNVSLATPAPSSAVWTMTFSPVTTTTASGPQVQPTTVPIGATVTIPGTTLTASVNPLFDVTINHSAIYVELPGFSGEHAGNCFSGSSLGNTVETFLDGNAASSQGGYCSGSTFGLAVDQQGNLWIADPGNNDLVQYPPFQGNGSQGLTVTGGTNGIAQPSSIAFDAANNAYLTNVASSNYGLLEYDAPTPGATPSFSSPAFTYLAANATQEAESVSVDSNSSAAAAPHVYAGFYDYVNTPHQQLVAWNHGNASPIMLPFTGASISNTAVEPYNNDLWTLYTPSFTSYTALLMNPSNATQIANLTGLPTQSTGLAVDMLGNVYIAQSSGTSGIVRYAPPNYPGTALLTSYSGIEQIAVYPGSILGNNAQVGVLASPLPSPFPLPTP